MDIAQILMYGVLFISLYFEVFLLITFFEHTAPSSSKTRKNAFSDIATLPRVAIITPCFNEEKTVAGTLESLLALEYPKDKLEIIAVNDGSTDNTLTVLHTFEHHESIRVLTKENGGKHSAMNLALQYTNAEFVGCLDADSFVEPDALRHIITRFEDEGIAAVTPSIKIHDAKGVIQTVQKAEYGLSVFIRYVFARLDTIFITPGPFSFFRRTAIDRVGPWRHAHSTEDLEICLRLQRNNMRIANEPHAIVHTTAPSTFGQLYKQRVRWTYGFIRNAVDYYDMFLNPRYGTLGLFVLPISVLSLTSAVFLFATVIWNLGVSLTEQIVRFQTIGIATPLNQFDVFYVNTSTLLGVTLLLLSLTVILMMLGKRLAKDSMFSFDIPVYLVVYGFITPIWLTAAIYKAITSNSVRWR